MKAKSFKFEMGATVTATLSGETGKVIGRAEYDKSESAFLVRYVAADGQQRTSWLSESELRAKAAPRP